MNRQQQKDLLTNLCNQTRDALLKRAHEWPEEWDGFELRWLLNKAVMHETRIGTSSERRYRDFENEWITRNLY